MSRPNPLAGVAAFAGWIALSVGGSVVLLPAHPLLRSVVWGVAVLLFSAAVAAPLRSLPLAGVVLAVSGVSSLAFGLAYPAVVAPIPLAAYLAGAALRAIYDIERPPAGHGLTPLWRAVAATSALSALSAWVGTRTAYLLLRDIPPPRIVNRLGLDVEQALAGTVAVLAALFLTAGFHALAVRAGREVRGARLLDATLVTVALVAGGTAILQKLGLVPHLRAPQWELWGRAQSTFTDPSAAGVAAALLLAPCLARAASGPWGLRLGAGAGVAGLLVLLADAGSRGGFIGALVSALVLVLWAATRALAGQRPGVRRRMALSAGTVSILVALAFGAALAWPSGKGSRSALLARLSESFGRREAPSLGEPETPPFLRGGLRPRERASGHGPRPRFLPDRVPRRGPRPPRKDGDVHRPPAVPLPRRPGGDRPCRNGRLRSLPGGTRSGARRGALVPGREDGGIAPGGRSGGRRRRDARHLPVRLPPRLRRDRRTRRPPDRATSGTPGGSFRPRSRTRPARPRRGSLGPPRRRRARPVRRDLAGRRRLRVRADRRALGGRAGAGRPAVSLDGSSGGASDRRPRQGVDRSSACP